MFEARNSTKDEERSTIIKGSFVQFCLQNSWDDLVEIIKLLGWKNEQAEFLSYAAHNNCIRMVIQGNGSSPCITQGRRYLIDDAG